MLKISFLVTFCGLLARMAQAQTQIPCNQYPVIVSNDCFSKLVAENVKPEFIAPTPPDSIQDQTTGGQYTGLTPTGKPDVSCMLNTQQNGGPIMITVSGNVTYKGKVSSPGSVKDASCDVANTATVPITVGVNSDGTLSCKGPQSTDEVQVACAIKRASDGLLSSLLGALLGLLDRLLTALGIILKGLLNTTLPNLLTNILGSMNNCMKNVTVPKPMGDTRICKQTVTTVTAGSNNCLYMTMESNKYSGDGTLIPPPNGTYSAPPLQPASDTGCMWVMSKELITNALGSIATTPFQVTGAALASLSAQLQALCGNGIIVERIVFAATGSLQVAITPGAVTATLTGNLQVFTIGQSSALFTYTATLTFMGTFDYVNPCVTLSLTANSLCNVQLVTGPTSCDMTGLVSQALIDGVKGKPTINKCVETSPSANLGLAGPTTFTPSNGYVICDHKL